MNKHIHLHIHRTYDAFVESEHPRSRSGKMAGEFVKKGTGTTQTTPTSKTTQTSTKTSGHLPGSRQAATTTQRKPQSQSTTTRRSSQTSSASPSHLPGGTKKRLTGFLPLPQDRSEWPDHIRKLAIPPAWTKVTYNPDPKGGTWVVGRDAGERRQSLRNPETAKQSKQDSYLRLKKLAPKMPGIIKTNDKNLDSNDARLREHAEVLNLIMQTGLRPGSERNTGAKEQAYGATTLQGRHIKYENGKTYLEFVGKEAVKQKQEVKDQKVARLLRERAKRAGENGKIFPLINDNSLRRYSQKISNNLANPKDFRTMLGTNEAWIQVKNMSAPSTKSAMKKAKQQIAVYVSKILGNTPAMAINSYIDPHVWAEWEGKLK